MIEEIGAARLILALLFTGLLLAAAAWDVACFRIPNRISGLLALGFAAVPAMAAPVDWAAHVTAGAVVLAVSALLFTLGLFGGGDAKLLSAAALWLGWDLLPLFLAGVALAGGVLAAGLVLARAALSCLRRLREGGAGRALPLVLRSGAPLPYGVAISAGALLCLPLSPVLA